MIVSRKNLLAKLRTIKPALAVNNRIPELTCFCFDGKRIMAFNDALAMFVPQQSDFKGVIASSLLDLLAASDATAVEINATNGMAQITLDGSVISLPMHPAEEFLFRMPSEWPTHGVPAAFLHAIEHCLPSISSNATVPEQLGITLIPAKDGLWFFGTDANTLRYTCLTSSPLKQKRRVILPEGLCRQMLALAKSAKTWRFDIYRDYALFAADDVLLFSKFISSEWPLDFVDVAQRHVPKDYASKAIALPKELRRLLKRSATVSASRDLLHRAVFHDATTISIWKAPGAARYVRLTVRLEVMDWQPK